MSRKAIRIVMLVLVLALAPAVGACPACKDQVPAQKTADGRPLVDPWGTQRGFALSIYVLLSAVYGLPCILGFVLWRSAKGARARNRARRAQAQRDLASLVVPAPTGDREAGSPAMPWGPAREEAGS